MKDAGRGVIMGTDPDTVLQEARARIQALDGPIQREI
jgi:hypothetical protein